MLKECASYAFGVAVALILSYLIHPGGARLEIRKLLNGKPWVFRTTRSKQS